MVAVDRPSVRTLLAILVPREARGAALLVGRQELDLERTTPLPWDRIEGASSRGEAIMVRPVPLPHPGSEPQAFSVWVHVPRTDKSAEQVAASFLPALPAAVVAGDHEATVYWRIHPTHLPEASALMEAIADAVEGVPGYPEEFCALAVRQDQVWVSSPATIWNAEALLSAIESASMARKLGRETTQTQDRSEAPDYDPGLEAARQNGWVDWEEASVAISIADQDTVARALMDSVMSGVPDVETALRTLGIDSAASVGGRFQVLRDGTWYRVVVRRVELALSPVASSDGLLDEVQVQRHDGPNVPGR